MQVLQQPYNSAFPSRAENRSLISRFIDWCTAQDKSRYGWLAVILTVHGCVLTPITVLLIATGANSIVYWGVAIGAIAMSVISNLAAMPTKITIPIFFFSVLVDLSLIVISLASFFG